MLTRLAPSQGTAVGPGISSMGVTASVVLGVPVVAGETGAGFKTLVSGAPGKVVTFQVLTRLRARE